MSVAARSDSSKRDWGSDDSKTPILHVDMDSFFAAVEVAEDPRLRNRPVIVGGVGTRGVVTSATYQVRSYGVRAGMPMARAKALCPQAIVLPGRSSLYREYSSRVMEVLSKVSEAFEPISIDEAFLDVSGALRRLGTPVEIAKQLRARVRDEVGLPASVGIAAVKSVAKIASAHAKPDGWLLVPADKTVAFLHGLPVGAVWGVGAKTESALTSRGIETVADLARTDIEDLRRWLGDGSAFHLRDLAWGKDPRSVGPRSREKSISTEQTFDTNIHSISKLEQFVLDASHQCATRLRKANLVGWTVTLKLRDNNFHTITRSKTLVAPSDVGRVIASAALSLVRQETIPAGGIRLAGVGVSSLASEGEGIPMLLDEDPRNRRAEVVMDRAAEMYGTGALKPASLIRTTPPVKKSGPPGAGKP